MMGIRFKGKHSKDFKVYIKTKNLPLIAQKRVSEEVVLGRDGSYKFEGGYADKSITLNCILLENDLILKRQKAREVAQWLSGEGELIFDYEPDKFYKAKVVNQIDNSIQYSADEFTVTFNVYPIAHSTYINEQVTLDDDVILYSDLLLSQLQNHFEVFDNFYGTITNIGTYRALPLIEIDGTAATIVIRIGDKQFSISNITQKTYVDCDKMICYILDGHGKKINKLKDFSGRFVELESGENNLSIEGSNLNVDVFFNFRNAYL